MLVVDANVVAYLLVEGDKTAMARALWAVDADWCSPGLVFYELANVFAQYVRQGAVSLEAAIAGLESAALLVRPFNQDPPAARVLEIASKLELSAYDATYLAAAEALGMRLVTEDRRLLRVAPGITSPLEALAPAAQTRLPPAGQPGAPSPH
jgi:predicted nucleic acid-binding protein